jgi:hypothetical protein
MGLSLVFGLLTFWLNFIPAVGAPLGVLLPMPFVALDPRFSTYQIAIAFVAPMALAFVNKDVIEPKASASGKGKGRRSGQEQTGGKKVARGPEEREGGRERGERGR